MGDTYMRTEIIKDVNNYVIQENERKFKRDIELIWHCDLEKLPIVYSFDFAFIRYNQIMGWIELKNRSFSSTRFQDSLINLSKWQKGIQLIETTGLPSVLGVRYTDVDLYYNFKKEDIMSGKVKIKWGARTKKTRDWQDIGPAVHIPISLFSDILDI